MESDSSLTVEESLFEITMNICNLFPYTLDYFVLNEMPASEVIELLCHMRAKGRRSAGKNTDKKVIKKKVYADQANWH